MAADLVVRDATETDAERIRDLFALVYGEDYPYAEFYSTDWLKKAIFSDTTVFLVAETEGTIVASASIMLDVGGLDDLIGELGRLVAAPSKAARGAAQALTAELLQRIEGRAQFAFGEVRTRHRGSQRLAESFGWAPVGFEPLKYQFRERESVAIYARLSPLAKELRRNNPRVIPEVYPLAQQALEAVGLPADAVCQDESEGYPTAPCCEIEQLAETGVSPLLRIERGRVTNREVFGKFSLAHGFFQIAASNTHYIVARRGGTVLGAAGLLHDPIDSKVRLLELIEFDDAVKGHLLAETERVAREEYDAAYVEVDISAHSPRMQRTLERLGFVPSAYCPSMVFAQVERLDIVRMAKLNRRYEPGRMRLVEGVNAVCRLVEERLEDRMVGLEITAATRQTEIFKNLPDGDLHQLARIGVLRDYKAGHPLIRHGETGRDIYVLASGAAEVRREGLGVIARLEPGTIVGEMALVEETVRSADVVLAEDARVIEIPVARFERLVQANPRLGYQVMRNLARSLSAKVRRSTPAGRTGVPASRDSARS